MAILLIDAGNTRLKFARWTERGLSDVQSLTYSDFASVSDLLAGLPTKPDVTNVYVANVAGKALEIDLLQHFKMLNLTPEFAISQKQSHGLVNAYISPQQLGIDRWLLMLAASVCFKSAFCVVSCGTAVTIDLVDSEGQHLGGVIMPGVAAMQAAMSMQTDAVSNIEILEKPPLLGLTTSQALSSGIMYSIADLIKEKFELLKTQCGPEVNCVLTGGDAQRVLPLLNIPAQFDEQLLFKGLAIYFGLTQCG
ncbi:MAG: type III pantothenate kinase [Gammaproteobacteria bacterium]|nr:type III pantothenate kinase [Gammaproteobacteria bacterium]